MCQAGTLLQHVDLFTTHMDGSVGHTLTVTPFPQKLALSPLSDFPIFDKMRKMKLGYLKLEELESRRRKQISPTFYLFLDLFILHKNLNEKIPQTSQICKNRGRAMRAHVLEGAYYELKKVQST